MTTVCATVTRTQGPEYVVESEAGQVLNCVLAGRRIKGGKPVVGDRVNIERISDDDRGVIIGVRPRTTLLRRAAFRGRGKALVANIDQLVITVSAQSPPLRPGLIDRYIVAAEKQQMLPALCFNKWELATPEDEAIYSAYESLGYACLKTSAELDTGIDTLAQQLHGRQSAFVGHSGVGKSSLMQRIFPDVSLAVGAVNDSTGRGRHTTTHARLLPLPSGRGYIVDTPGVREFGLIEIESAELASLYVDFSQPSERCRFSPCTHTHEPDCGVKEGVETGDIHGLRYKNYLRLFAELKEKETARYR